jgi:hypothetical protein
MTAPAAAAGTAHTNSTDEAVLGSVLIPANTLGRGVVLEVAGQVRATATNSTDTLIVNARVHTSAAVAGTVVGTSGAVDATNDDVVDFDLRIIPRSAQNSTSGGLLVIGSMTAVGAEGTVTRRAVHQVMTGVDYAADQYLVISADWSAASTGDSCQLEAIYSKIYS